MISKDYVILVLNYIAKDYEGIVVYKCSLRWGTCCINRLRKILTHLIAIRFVLLVIVFIAHNNFQLSQIYVVLHG